MKAWQQPKPVGEPVPTGTIGLNSDQRANLYYLRTEIDKIDNKINQLQALEQDPAKAEPIMTIPESDADQFKNNVNNDIFELLARRQLLVQRLKQLDPAFEQQPKRDLSNEG